MSSDGGRCSKPIPDEPAYRRPNTEYRIQYRIQNTEYRIQKTEYRIQYRIQNTEYNKNGRLKRKH